MKASENPFPKITLAESAAPGTPTSGQGYIYASTGGTPYYVNDSGVETALGGGSSTTIATDAIWDAKGDLAGGTGANTAARLAVGTNGYVLTAASGETTGLKWASPFKGYPIALLPVGCAWATAGTIGSIATNNTADIARAAPVSVPAAMYLRSLWIWVTANGSGSVEWGLFDLSSTLTAATKVAGGSAAPGGTNVREIAAAGGPILIDPGMYMLIIENPAANQSTIGLFSTGLAPGFFKAWSTYTWDDTPDLTSGSWAESSLFYACYLEGDIDASATRW